MRRRQGILTELHIPLFFEVHKRLRKRSSSVVAGTEETRRSRGTRRVTGIPGKLLVGLLALSTPAVAGADVVVDWTVLAGNTAGGVNGGARNMAVVSLAMFEAVNAITGDYEPYLGTVSAPVGASPEAAAVAAAYRVLRTYVTAPATVAALDAARAASQRSPMGRRRTTALRSAKTRRRI
jgi:hypothetical protein